MSLRSIPLTFIAFLLYFIVVLFSGMSDTAVQDAASACSGAASEAVSGCTKAAQAKNLLAKEFFTIPMMSGAQWSFTWGDLIILVTLAVLFAEILKATYTSTASLVDHGLSMLVFVAALVAFLLVPEAATSVFFLLLLALLIDVIAGFTIGIRVAKRDIGFGGGDQ
ncbi:MAG: hypothetical protein ACT4N2_06335 [Hyphomicrobium sp.]